MRRIGIILALLLLAACAQEGPARPQAGVPFIGGNDGIEVGLIDGMPPAQVYDGDRMDFGIGVAVENLGEADVGEGTDNPFLRARISGFPPAVFGLTSDAMKLDYERTLLGARKNFDGTILPGGLDRLTFEGLRYEGQVEGDYIQNFLVDVCYDYETTATVPLCFKREVIENVQDAQVCTLTGEKLPRNSGAPLHVTSVVQNPLGEHRIMVNLILEHVGTGDFYGRHHGSGDAALAASQPAYSVPQVRQPGGRYAPGDPELCDPSITNTNKFRVEVEVYPNEGSEMSVDCSGFGDAHPHRGVVTLFQGAPATLTCTLENVGPDDRPYVDLLNVKLRYRYGESVIQPVVVKAVGSAN